jgi:hypothetical protein
LAARQPVHEHSYLTFKGEIPAGQYGAGAVEPLDVGKALITKATPTQVNLILAHKRRPEEYTLVKTKKDWLMVNTTPDDAELLERYPKERYKSADPAMFKQLVKDRITSAKIDGANILAVLKRNKMRVFSSRISQTGKPIEHTHRIGGLTGLTVPPELRGIVLRGELYGEKAGKAIPPQQLSALLNSTLQNALERKAKDDIKLRLALFDVAGKEPLK